MIIDKNDFKDILKKVRQHYDYGANTVMSKPFCDKNDLHFCIGSFDEQEFYHTQPDAHDYEAISVRHLYETMALIDKDKLAAREWLPEKKSFQYESPFFHQWIDLGSMMEERGLIESLHHRMKHADWYYDYSDDHCEWKKGRSQIQEIQKDLLTLSQWESGQLAAGQLWGKYVPPYSVRKPDFLTIKSPTMDEKARLFNENQLKRTGFAEAYTPDLQAKMAQGLPEIKHPFAKRYEGDEVNALLHLKKSATSDYYFLNKFDLRLQKEGQSNSVNQTFYLTRKNAGSEEEGSQRNRLENKYTLKEGYNLLSGRPVFKDLVNQAGEPYQAWVKLNFKNALNNGNHELKQYHTNYGFELDKVMGHYPIKELTNPQYKQSLIDSLHRGNLQKATFVGPDGKEEKLFISPNISFGSLNVYDANKQRLPTESLVEKQFIGNDLAQQLIQRVKQQQKTPDTPAHGQPSESIKGQTPTGAASLVDPKAAHQVQKMAEEQKINGPKVVPGAVYLVDPAQQHQGKTIKKEQKQTEKQQQPAKKQRHKQKIK